MSDFRSFDSHIHVLRCNWAESIRQIIEDRGLTIKRFTEEVALATDVELSTKTVSRWMDPSRDKGLPEYEKMQAVAFTFGTPIANLLKDDAYDGGRTHVSVTDMHALERVLNELDFATQGDPNAAKTLHDVIASRSFARLVFRIFYMREEMPHPEKPSRKRLDEFLRDSDRAAELRELVKDAAEKLVNDLTPLPPCAVDYVPVDLVERHLRELAAVDERDDSPVPWSIEDEWLPSRGE